MLIFYNYIHVLPPENNPWARLGHVRAHRPFARRLRARHSSTLIESVVAIQPALWKAEKSSATKTPQEYVGIKKNSSGFGHSRSVLGADWWFCSCPPLVSEKTSQKCWVFVAALDPHIPGNFAQTWQKRMVVLGAQLHRSLKSRTLSGLFFFLNPSRGDQGQTLRLVKYYSFCDVVLFMSCQVASCFLPLGGGKPRLKSCHVLYKDEA